jgi:hypothetical protein
LIVGAAVCRTKVKGVVGLHVVLQSEGDAHEAARSFSGSGRRRAGDFCLDNDMTLSGVTLRTSASLEG